LSSQTASIGGGADNIYLAEAETEACRYTHRVNSVSGPVIRGGPRPSFGSTGRTLAWGYRRIQGEMLKLGLRCSRLTVLRMPPEGGQGVVEVGLRGRVGVNDEMTGAWPLTRGERLQGRT